MFVDRSALRHSLFPSHGLQKAKICLTSSAILIVAAVGNALAAAPDPMTVTCGAVACGTMNFSKYQTGETGTGTGQDPYRGFVDIAGSFTPAGAGLGKTYHYIQAVVVDNRPPAFTDGTAITTPYIDPPPGGYQGDAFDLKPYYDETEFPTFSDKPTINLAFTKNQPNGQRNLEFETWLVCVMQETFGANANKASDDTFKVAPLIGWKWGFQQNYVDAPPIGTDGLEDISQTIVPFAYLATPSANWTAALGTVYGTNPNQDNFNVTVGNCVDCGIVPEPTSAVMMVLMFGMVCCPFGSLLFVRRRSARAPAPLI
jgi:hypothetical protein